MLMKIFLILYILNKSTYYIYMDEIKNDINLLKYIYEKANDNDFIKHSFEIYFPIILNI